MPPLMNALLQTYLGDCLKILPKLPSGSMDSLVTDPPAAINFMGKAWDGNKGGREQWISWLSEVMKETLRVVKPGAFGLVWALPRTSHWTGMGLELAGWEIRDRVAHIFGTGFPKSKSCLKPAVEDWWLIKAPGKLQPLQIDTCRIPGKPEMPGSTPPSSVNGQRGSMRGSMDRVAYDDTKGRWPANLILDQEAARLLDEQTGVSQSAKRTGKRVRPASTDLGCMNDDGWKPKEVEQPFYGDSGGASRFFFCAKASKKDRGEGNTHNTVKPMSLMQWLCRLVTPPGGLILDPFMGSASTGVAALREGFRFLGIEENAEYLAIARARLRREREEQPRFHDT